MTSYIFKNAKNLIYSSILISLSACNSLDSAGMMPGPLFATNFPPKGPPNYQQGIVDGCKTASGAVGGSLYSIIYDQVYYDVDKAINDKVYYTAWKDGYDYCKLEFDSTPMS